MVVNNNNKEISISTFNIYGIYTENMIERNKKIANILLDQKSDIICLQELSSHISKSIILNTLSLEYIYDIYSDSSSKYNIISMFPSILLSFFCIYCNSLILSFLSILFLPSVSKEYFNIIYNCDMFAQGIFVRKKICDELQLLRQISFTDIYQYNNLLEYWFCNTFLHPGFAISRCIKNNKTEFIIVNCHLIPCERNYNIRLSQVKQIIKYIDIEMKKYKCNSVIWCGDFNANPDEPCIQYIRELYNIHSDSKTLITYSGKQIDYIISSKNIKSKNISIFGHSEKYPVVTEHFGILCNSEKYPIISDHFGLISKSIICY